MEKRKKGAKLFMLIAIGLLLISMIGASLVQTSGGKVTVKDIRFETTTGYQMSGLLFVPKGVSAENPAPAIVASHGMYNNREMQDLNFVELSRRGYVVFSMDMISHGNSDNTDESTGTVLTGMYEAVKMLDSLNYVNSEKIGITGHSLGGMSSNQAVVLDNAAERQLISAVLLNSADAEYQRATDEVIDRITDEETGEVTEVYAKEYYNLYGSRDVGIVAPQYDEFFFSKSDKEGNPTTAPRDFLQYENAQSFLHFGIDASGKEMRKGETIYQETVDGEQAIRVIYNPSITHPWSHFSKRSTVATVEFFEAALGAPNAIAGTNQVWQWKVVFNFMGLIGIVFFLISFTVLMVFTPFFSSLRAKELVKPVKLQKGGSLWFWGSLVAGAVFGLLTYSPILTASKAFISSKELAQTSQTSPWGISLWAMACGLFTILCLVVSYLVYGKKNGMSLSERGVTMPAKKFGKTILLSLIVFAVTYSWVFVADYFFKVDFRIWVIAMKAFEADKIWVSLFPYAVFFLIYYIANSVAVNSFNYNTIGKKPWVNTAIVAGFNAIPPLVLLLIQYIPFRITGFMTWPQHKMIMIWLMPILVFLPLTAVISRKIYKVTNNPYIGGIVNALLVTIISCSNTLTWG